MPSPIGTSRNIVKIEDAGDREIDVLIALNEGEIAPWI
jgi:hypothetical protein